MKKIAIILLLILTACSGEEKMDIPKLTCSYFTESLFYKNISNAKGYEVNSKPIAIVIPHNESIMYMAASTIKSVSEYNYDTIIILAPNHKAKTGKLLVSGESWRTPTGDLEGNNEIKDKIVNSFGKGIIEEHDVIQEDHSASVIMPYISYYMPKKKVVTLLFDKEISVNEIEKIAKNLEEISKEQSILLIGSIDFAHYQDYPTTVERDNETIRLIKDFNIEQLKALDGENIDTSESMGVILTYVKNKGVDKIEITEKNIIGNAPSTDDYGSYMSIII